MSRYSRYTKDQEEPKWKVHPVWRGFGCLFIIIIPIMAITGAQLFVTTNADMENPILPLPKSMMDKVMIKGFEVPGTVISVPSNLFSKLRYADILFTFVFMFIGFGLFSVVYGFAYRVVGPPLRRTGVRVLERLARRYRGVSRGDAGQHG